MDFVLKFGPEIKDANIDTAHAKEDADLMIVQAAIDKINCDLISMIIRQDIDLLVLLIQFLQPDDKIFLLKLDQVAEIVWYGPDFFKLTDV